MSGWSYRNDSAEDGSDQDSGWSTPSADSGDKDDDGGWNSFRLSRLLGDDKPKTPEQKHKAEIERRGKLLVKHLSADWDADIDEALTALKGMSADMRKGVEAYWQAHKTTRHKTLSEAIKEAFRFDEYGAEKAATLLEGGPVVELANQVNAATADYEYLEDKPDLLKACLALADGDLAKLLPLVDSWSRETLRDKLEADDPKRLKKVDPDEYEYRLWAAAQRTERKKIRADRAKMDALTEKATKLFAAMDRPGTDEKAIFDALKGLSYNEGVVLKDMYKERYGKKLIDHLRDELDDEDFAEAKGHLSGNKVKATIGAIKQAVEWLDDDDKVEEYLRALSDADRKKLLSAARSDKELAKILDDLRDNESFDALLDGDKAKADAIALDDELDRGWVVVAAFEVGDVHFGGLEIGGADMAEVEKRLEGKDPAYLAKVREVFAERQNATMFHKGEKLEDRMHKVFDHAKGDLGEAIAKGDKAGAGAARLQMAARGAGTDEKLIEKALLAAKTPKERRALSKKFDDKYGKDWKGKYDWQPAIQRMLEEELGGIEGKGEDLEQAKKMFRSGKLPDHMALRRAMEGAGTDEKAIQGVLRGKTKAALDKIAADYRIKYGEDLADRLAEELSGRDAFEAKLILKYGKPKTPREMFEVARAWYDFERGSGAGLLGGAAMATAEGLQMTEAQSQLDKTYKKLMALFDSDGNMKKGVSAKDVERLFGYVSGDLQSYQATIQTVSDAICTSAEIAVAAVATLVTDGACAPWLAAVIVGAVTTATGIVIKRGLGGEAYGSEAIGSDVLVGAIGAALAGKLATKGFAKWLDELVAGVGDDAARAILKEAVKGGIGGVSEGTLQGLLNDDNWRAGLEHYLAGIAKSSGKGLVKGTATGAVGEAVKGKIGGPPTAKNAAKAGAAANVTSSALGTTLDLAADAVFEGKGPGSLEDVIAKYLAGMGKGAVVAGVGAVVSRATLARKLAYQIRDGVPVEKLEGLEVLDEAERKGLRKVIVEATKYSEEDKMRTWWKLHPPAEAP